ncbi:MAG TPA: hypothetical protein VG982_02085 [Candidatus Paceibacterota bacterium]|nr:hypothetical protein [Candidatus Paceibacterota bacterium]
MRRRISIIIVILLVGVIAWRVAVRFKQPTTTSQTTGGIFQTIFPGRSSTPSSDTITPSGTIGNAGDTVSTGEAVPFSSLKQLTHSPVAGLTLYTSSKTVTVPATDPKKKSTTQTLVERTLRYVSKTTGYVYEIKDGGIPLQISNVYIPNVYEASFADGGKTALLRFLRDDSETIATYSVPIPDANPDGTRTQKSGTYLPDDVFSLAVSPDGTTVGRLTFGANGTTLSTSDSSGNKGKTLLTNPFHGWLLSWPQQNNFYLQTKASASADGFLYRVSTTDKRLRKVLGNISGLTTSVSPSGTYVLYSQSGQGGFLTRLLNTKTGATKAIAESILPEKCAWLKNEDLICAGNDSVPQGQYPDDWYMGLVHFSDKLYHIYTSAAVIDTIYDGGDQSFDATTLTVDEDARVVYFIDNGTGALWQFSY